MKKLINAFLFLTINLSLLSGQTFGGNYTVDSATVQYTFVVRDIVQEGSDGHMYTTAYDSADATYDVTVGWPGAGDDAEFDFSLPYFSVGDTAGGIFVNLPSPAALLYGGIGLNVDFNDDGSFIINSGSIYPTTQTVDCVTSQIASPAQELGDWTDGGFDPVILGTNSIRYGWGITLSGIFANFQAPDMVNWTEGVEYGVGTDMQNWGYLDIHYEDPLGTAGNTPAELNLGWTAHDGPDANIGIVSDDDNYYSAEEEALGLLNGMLGRNSIPIDSVTIPAIAAVAAASGITINVPTENPPYMAGGTGLPDPTTGEIVGATTNDQFYVFDPTGDILGGGDGVLFSGDEGLASTGYYATWNTLRTLNAITYGAGYGQLTGATTPAEFAEAIMDAVYTQWYLDTDSLGAIQVPIDNAGNVAPAVTVVQTVLTDSITSWTGQYMAAGMPQMAALIEAIGNTLPIVLGGLTTMETVAPGLFEDWDGDSVTVDDSWSDLESEYWWWFDNDNDGEDSAGDSLDADGNLLSRFDPVTGMASGTYMYGGRIFVQSYNNCFPVAWTQRINTHWTYMGALSSVDEDMVAESFELKGNYPNPFNPTTKIRFSNDRTSNVKVNVYSLKGEKVATIMNKEVNAGTYDVSWNGKNSSGKLVPTGMYVYDIESAGRRLQGKMIFLK